MSIQCFQPACQSADLSPRFLALFSNRLSIPGMSDRCQSFAVAYSTSSWLRANPSGHGVCRLLDIAGLDTGCTASSRAVM